MGLHWAGSANAQEGRLLWPPFALGGSVVGYSSPAVSPDGSTVYVGTIATQGLGGWIVAVRSNGSLKWQLRRPDLIQSSPAIAADGTLYFVTVGGLLHSITDTGSSAVVNWVRDLQPVLDSSSSPALAPDGATPDGMIYAAAGSRLHAYTRSGDFRWHFDAGDRIDSSPAVGPDGTIYFGSDDRHLYAVAPNGQERWRFQVGSPIFASPAIGTDGTIYVGSTDQRLYAIAADGTRKWEFLVNGPIQASVALGADDTIYFPADRNLYALRPGGTNEERLIWKAPFNSSSISTPAVRADGTIVFADDDGRVHAFRTDGTKKWQLDTGSGEGSNIESSPLVAPDGSIYIGSLTGRLYKIEGNGSPLSQYSSWPAFRGNVRRTGYRRVTNQGGYLANIATRAHLGADDTLIAGFVVQGASKAYLIRAAGPALGSVGVSNFLPDPKLALLSGNVPLRANDDWPERDGFSLVDTQAAVGAFPFLPGSKDAALISPLGPGRYDTHVQSADGQSGVALVEVYDAGVATDDSARLINLSTRGRVGTGDDVMIAGVVVGGVGSRRLLLRAVGPGLAQFGVSGVLARPRLELFKGQQSLGVNIGWASGVATADLAGAAAMVSAFPLSPQAADSAMLVEVLPGLYTVHVSGVGGTTGEALVEVYVLP